MSYIFYEIYAISRMFSFFVHFCEPNVGHVHVELYIDSMHEQGACPVVIVFKIVFSILKLPSLFTA